MKLKSKGQVIFEMDDEELKQAAKDDTTWRYKMLENSTKTAVLMEQSCEDHREFRTLLYRAIAILSAIAAAVGVPLGMVL